MTCDQQVSAACQTGYFQDEENLEFELNKKNRELERSVIKLKEVELDIKRKDLVIEGVNKKVFSKI